MNLSNKKVLVTGAGGFIGSHLVEGLIKEGADVKAFVRYNSRSDFGMLEWLPSQINNEIEVVMGDLRDSHAVQKAVKGCDVVFHLGALVGIPYSYVHPRETVETNFMGTLNVLQASLDEDVERVVHTSTSETFGTAQYVPINEDHPINPQSPYAASKAGADYLAISFQRSFGLPVNVLRPFNTFGPRQSARAIIPAIIVQALTKPVINLGSITPTRDFTYVKDTANAFIKSCKSEDAIGQTINVGNNKEITIEDLTKLIFSVLEVEKEIVSDDDRMRPKDSEVQRLCVDNTQAEKIMGWKPETSLRDGIVETAKWIKDNIKIYKPDRYVI